MVEEKVSQLVAKGAEANLWREKSDDGEILIKDRIKKGYRAPALDEKIRRDRTRLEARLLRAAARVGVSVPGVIETADSALKIEFLEGSRLKELLSEKNYKELAEKIGAAIGRLHSAGIVHGDLTTSNMILKDEKIFFIDFGLGFFSKHIEDQATDLHLLLEALRSTHFEIAEQAFEVVVEAYKKEYENAQEVLTRLKKIEARGRYVHR